MTDGVGNRGAKNITLPTEVHKKAKTAAIELGVSLQQLIAQAVTEKLEQKPSTESSSELRGKYPGGKVVSGLATMPGGLRISKSLMDLVPQLEAVLQDKDASRLLKLLIHNLHHRALTGD